MKKSTEKSQSKIKEKSVEAYLKKQCEMRGGFCIKQNARWNMGIPDRLCGLPHFMCLVETKRPVGGVLAPIQKWWQKKCKKLDIPHYVLSSQKEVDDFLSAYDTWLAAARRSN